MSLASIRKGITFTAVVFQTPSGHRHQTAWHTPEYYPTDARNELVKTLTRQGARPLYVLRCRIKELSVQQRVYQRMFCEG